MNNPEIILDLEQRTDAWYKIRAGILTASQASRIITPKTWKATSKSTWESLALELCSESIAYDEEGFQGNYFTDRGIAMEPYAIKGFEEATGIPVHECGFIRNMDNWIGCSPDSIILEDGVLVGGLECKAPMGKKHVEYAYRNTLPEEYKAQVHFSMICANVQNWHFTSFHPKFKQFIHLVQWDEDTETLKKITEDFINYLKEMRPKILKNVILK